MNNVCHILKNQKLQFIYLQNVNENQNDQNEKLFDQIQRIEDELSKGRLKYTQIVNELEKKDTQLKEYITSIQNNEQINQQIRKKNQELEELINRLKNEIQQKDTQIGKLISKIKDQDDKLQLKDLEIKNYMKENEKQQYASIEQQQTQHDSIKKEKKRTINYMTRNKSNTVLLKSETLHSRSQSHYIGQFDLEQFKEQCAASVKSQNSESEDDQTDKKTLKQENDEQQELERLIVELKSNLEAKTNQLQIVENEKKQCEAQIITLMSEISVFKIKEKKMTLQQKQQEKRLTELQSEKNKFQLEQEQLEQRMNEIQGQHQQKMKLMSSVINENDQLKKRLSLNLGRVETQQQIDKDIIKLKQEYDDMIMEMQKQNMDLHFVNEELIEENNKINEQIKQISEQQLNDIVKIQQLEKQLEQMEVELITQKQINLMDDKNIFEDKISIIKQELLINYDIINQLEKNKQKDSQNDTIMENQQNYLKIELQEQIKELELANNQLKQQIQQYQIFKQQEEKIIQNQMELQSNDNYLKNEQIETQQAIIQELEQKNIGLQEELKEKEALKLKEIEIIKLEIEKGVHHLLEKNQQIETQQAIIQELEQKNNGLQEELKQKDLQKQQEVELIKVEIEKGVHHLLEKNQQIETQQAIIQELEQKNNGLQEELKQKDLQKQQEVELIKVEIEKGVHHLLEKNQQIETQQAIIQELEQKNNGLQEELKQKDLQKQQEVELIKVEIEKGVHHLLEKNQQIETQQAIIQELEQKNNGLQEELKQKDLQKQQEVELIKVEIEKGVHHLLEKNQQIETQQAIIQELEQKNNGLQEELKQKDLQKQQEVELIKVEIEKGVHHLLEKNQQIETQQAIIQELEQKNNGLQEELKQKDLQKQQEVELIKVEIEKGVHHLLEKNQQIETQQAIIQELEQKNNGLQEELKQKDLQKQQEVELIKVEIEKGVHHLLEKNQQIETQQAIIQELEQKNNGLQEELKQKDLQKQQEVELIKVEIEKGVHHLLEKNQQIETQQAIIQELEQKNNGLQEELKQKDLQKQQEVELIKVEIEKGVHHLLEKNQQIETQQAIIQELEQKNNGLQEELKQKDLQKQQEVELIKVEIEKGVHHLLEKNQQIETQQAIIQELEQKNNGLQEELKQKDLQKQQEVELIKVEIEKGVHHLLEKNQQIETQQAIIQELEQKNNGLQEELKQKDLQKQQEVELIKVEIEKGVHHLLEKNQQIETQQAIIQELEQKNNGLQEELKQKDLQKQQEVELIKVEIEKGVHHLLEKNQQIETQQAIIQELEQKNNGLQEELKQKDLQKQQEVELIKVEIEKGVHHLLEKNQQIETQQAIIQELEQKNNGLQEELKQKDLQKQQEVELIKVEIEKGVHHLLEKNQQIETQQAIIQELEQKNNGLQEELKQKDLQKQQEVELIKVEIEKGVHHLLEKNQQIETQQAIIQELEQKNNGLQEELKQKDLQKQQEVELIKVEIEKGVHHLLEKNQQIETQQAIIQELEQKNNGLQEELKQKDLQKQQEVELIKVEIEKGVHHLLEKNQQIETQQAIIQELEQKNNGLQEELKQKDLQKQQEVELIKVEIEKGVHHLLEKNQQIETQQAIIQELEQKNNGLQEELKQKDLQKQQEVELIKVEIEKGVHHLLEKNQQIETQQAIIQELEQKNNGLQEELKEKEALKLKEIEIIKLEIEKGVHHLLEKNQQIETQQAIIQELELKTIQLKQEFEQANFQNLHQIEQLKIEEQQKEKILQQQHQSIQSLEKLIEQQNTQLEQLKNNTFIQNQEQQIQILQQEIHALKLQIEQQDDHQKVYESILNKQIEKLKQINLSQQTQIHSLTQDKEKLQSICSQLKQIENILQDELHKMQDKIDELCIELDKVQQPSTRSSSISSQNKTLIYEQFFHLTSQSVQMNSNHQNAFDVKLKSYYSEVVNQGVPFHKWSKWLEDKLKEELNKFKR
ncbi:unnamed protein product [Paramecium primaurelia]|uniref:Uncharacterized protein n=1 Tax=Paramecium primaurelia TaxID=5886 RepID=A0A8S1KWG1_PARPR|nr:unnamed protein product [Paramecium primaurelia]